MVAMICWVLTSCWGLRLPPCLLVRLLLSLPMGLALMVVTMMIYLA